MEKSRLLVCMDQWFWSDSTRVTKFDFKRNGYDGPLRLNTLHRAKFDEIKIYWKVSNLKKNKKSLNLRFEYRIVNCSILVNPFKKT